MFRNIRIQSVRGAILLHFIFQGIGAILVLALVFGLVASYQREHPSDIACTVSPADCKLCGTANPFQSTDTLAFVQIRGEHWDLSNIGFTDVVPPQPPYLDPNWTHKAHAIHLDQKKCGTYGLIQTSRRPALIQGSLGIGRKPSADAAYLATILCERCYEKVYPATRTLNCFLYTCQEGQVYSLDQPWGNFYAGNYQVSILHHPPDALTFSISPTIPHT